MPAGAEPLRIRDALALGLMHGPAELLPVSSSGHVAIIPWLCGWPYSRLDGELRKAFEVALHAGTAAALLVGLRDEVADAARELDRRRIELVVLSFLPPAIVAYTLERPIERGVAGRRRRSPAGSSPARWRCCGRTPAAPAGASAAARTPARSTRSASASRRPAR